MKERMLNHFYKGHPIPPEYLELYLIREVYHCYPLPPAWKVMQHLQAMHWEQYYRDD